MILDAEGVSFSYNGEAVLSDVTIDIEEGDFVAVIGPNGSGKTTLIKIMLGLLAPRKGRVRLFGKDITDFRDWGLVGYIPQKSEIDRNFPGSVQEILGLKGGLPDAKVLRLLDIEKVAG
ncbi:MAG: ATP-binding cassette domain-containing protein, partial [Candidatus Micrarchaeota archaeon]